MQHRHVPPPSRHAYHSESDAVRVRVGRNLVAARTPQHGHVVIHPGSAANDAHVAGVGPARIVHVTAAIIFGAVPVGYPFPDVASDVAQTIPVGGIGAARPRTALTFG